MRGPSFCREDLERRSEVEVGTPMVDAPMRSLNFSRRDSEVEVPEDDSEKWNGVRSRLDAILGVLSRGTWSSGRGRSFQRQKRGLGTEKGSSEKGRKQSTSRSP